MPRLLFIALLLVLPAAPAHALPEAMEAGRSATVVAVIDGDTVVLDDSLEVRLVGIQAPKLPLGRARFRKWPLADEAKAALQALVRDRRVTLAYGGRRTDRHRRALAHLYLDDGTWVQGALLTDGWARVYSFADNRALVADMLAAERQARAARRGIWRHPFYAIVDQRDAGNHLDRFTLVEGTVVDAAIVRSRGYLNFGADWRTDFTVSVAPRDMRSFDDFAAYAGARIRVRGWLKSFNGPLIDATHPEQIEVLGE